MKVGIDIADIREAVRELGLAGRPLCVHSSLRSFGRVEGGARAVIEGLLAEGCTIMVPSFTYHFAVPPPEGTFIARNGEDGWARHDTGSTLIYHPATAGPTTGMGAIPDTLLSMAGSVRGEHPLNGFAALGPLAHDLIDGQRPLHVYAPLERLVERGGFVVMMGVGLTRMTIIHLAEARAGRTLFRRWANGPDGRAMEVEVGSCSSGFDRFDPVLAAIERDARVGESLWRAFPADAVVAAASAAIRATPAITHCENPDCVRCNDAVAGGPIL